MTVKERVYSDLYFGIQRIREGVTREMIDRASEILSAPWTATEMHIHNRLRAMYGDGAESTRWLESAPLTSKREIQESQLGTLPAARDVRLEKRRTSGSTGAPFTFYKDVQMTAWMDAAMWAAYRWHGVQPGMRHARFWGMPLTKTARLAKRLRDRGLNRRRINAFELDDSHIVRHYHKLRRFEPRYVYGYPTLLKQFAESCIDLGLTGRDIGVQVIITTGELITLETRKLLRDFFGCNVVNEYGCSESGVLAMECEFGALHVIPVAAYMEVVSADGKPVPVGDSGEVVVSDLHGRAQCLLRYRLNDRASRREIACGCGRDLPQIALNAGRVDSFIRLPSGRLVYDAVLAYSVPMSVQRFKAYQRSDNELVVEIVPHRHVEAPVAAAECKLAWETALSGEMSVNVILVREIPPEPSGKLRYFVPMVQQDRSNND
jgi:phenylacetate-CoA ligase